MSDFIMFTEGKNYLLTNGLPATCYFSLSTKGVDAGTAFTASDTLVGGVGRITGTGYSDKSQAKPTPASGSAVFALMAWLTSTATDWPASVRSFVLKTTADETGKAIAAWNLQTGGTPRDLSGANTTENVTPTLGL